MAVLPTGIGPVTGGYQIERSLRFNSADSAYLNRTPGSASNQKTWTWSGWVKRSTLGALQGIFNPVTGGDGSNESQFKFNADDTLQIYDSGAARGNFITTQVFRDVSAWYHIVVVLDTTQATSTNRFKLYVNGVQVTAFSTASYPSQNTDWGWNRTVRHDIGRYAFGSTQYFNGYMTEINFVDGQALTPSDFGETDSNTGVWKPKAYTGTYGTNGFYLKFADNSGTTSTTLGKDSSGNGNNWTPNNFSVTAGSGNDSLVDSPTNYGTDTGVGGTVRGNYCTWNPLDKNSNGSLLNGNLDNSNSSANNAGVRSTFALPSSEKWYAELRVNTSTSGSVALGFGFATASADLAGSVDGANKYDIYGSSSGYIFSNTSTITSSLGAFTAGDILQIAYDGATGKAWLGKNNTWYNSSGGTTGDPAAGTNQTFTFTTQMFLYSYYYNVSGSLNCGQRAFAYTAPSGFKALCTTNLPTPTIGATSTTQANDYFDAVLWTGDTSLSRNITGWDFNLGLLWVKQRSTVRDNWLVDRVRGAQIGLVSNSTSAEATDATATNAFVDSTSPNANGFTAGNGSAVWGGVNSNGGTYVGWGWNAGGSNATNTSGTITSTVRANTTSGFSIVTYTGTGSNATVGHGLGVAPSMIIIKRTNSTNSWQVYHSNANASPASGGLFLNTTDAFTALSTTWNSTVPASTVFSIGTAAGTNASGGTYVAYCFAPVAGYSAFGSYTGNGSTDGPFVYTGFAPKYVLVKSSSEAGQGWIIADRARSTYNVSNQRLRAETSDAEGTDNGIDFLSNGFKVRTTNWNNTNGQTQIYAAFAESPFKYSLAR